MRFFQQILTVLTMGAIGAGGVPTLFAQGMDKMWGDSELSGKEATRRGRYFDAGNYAMFVHWGLYSQIAGKWSGKNYYGISEWIMHRDMAGIPVEEYKAVARTFNPVRFDARKLARLAKDAGMKYIVITSKHHDGFAMYHSKCDSFNIVDATSFGRDPMRELANACRELGLGFGFYYSHNQDWTHPGGHGGPAIDAAGKRKTFDDYFNEKCLPQVEEITKNYGEIELVWFDTPGRMPRKYARQLAELVRKNQPRALVSGRIGHGLGDYRTFGDMEVPLQNVPGLWEGVDVTNDSWGFAWYDSNWKTPRQILERLVATVARGGTYMLNVGPDQQGEIPGPAQSALRLAGKWIAAHPQVVYSAQPSPWKHAFPWGDVVVNNGKLHLVVFQWPATGKLHLPGLNGRVGAARLLSREGAPTLLETAREGAWTVITVPFKKPDSLASVIEIEADLQGGVDDAFAVDPEFGLELSALFGRTTDCRLSKRKWMEKYGEWKHVHQVENWGENSAVQWEFEIKEPGRHLVEITCSAGTQNPRRVFNVKSDEGRSIQNQQIFSPVYLTRPIGWLDFEKAGRHSVTLTLPEGERAGTSVKSIKITRADF
ncbi:MAG: alpha-L-fucosidase [Puniceicoccales bacterium]|nr:alpha-L-fucosidase [Puniceicoccales bacterium]